MRPGDLRGSRTGVRGRLGILSGLAATGDDGFTSVSVFTNAGRSPVGTPKALFGGDSGGSTVSEGGCWGRGLMGGGRERVGETESATSAAGGLVFGMFNLSLGRIAGTGGGSRASEGLASRSRSRPGLGTGAGEVVREAAAGGASVLLFRFSNLARSDETGLWVERSDNS